MSTGSQYVVTESLGSNLEMKRQSALSQASAHDVCIFCAVHLSTLSVAPRSLRRFASPGNAHRSISNTRGPLRSDAGSSAQATESTRASDSSRSWPSSDPDAGLTATERAEKAARLRLKAERDGLRQQLRESAGLNYGVQQTVVGRHGRYTPSTQSRLSRDPSHLAAGGAEVDRKDRTDSVRDFGLGGQATAERWSLNRSRNVELNKSTRSPKVSRSGAGVNRSSPDTNQPGSARMTRPSFLQSSTGASSATSPPSSGWGSGTTDTPPLEYGDPTLSQAARLRESRSESMGASVTPSKVAAPPQSHTARYNISPIRSDELLKDDQPDPVGIQSDWKHIRRSGLDIASRSGKNAASISDNDWVDRKFLDHLQGRQAPPPIIDSNADPRISAVRQRNRDGAKCAICSQVGHIARECPDRVGMSYRPLQNKAVGSASTPKANDGAQNITSRVAKECDTTSQEGSSKASHQPMYGSKRLIREANDKNDRGLSATSAEPEADDRRQIRRRDKWGGADDLVEDAFGSKKKDRKRKTGNRFSNRDEDDEDGTLARREEFRQKKTVRKADRIAKTALEQKEARMRREARKAEGGAPINLPSFINVQQLAQALGERYEPFVDRLEELGYDDIFPGKVFNSELSSMIAMEYGFDPQFGDGKEEDERDLRAAPIVTDTDLLPARPPVVTIMGHVDHGKTTILDYLRKSSVAAGEAGGITQHIGAFSVPLSSSGRTITFLDTPGHAAFLAMRQRGANVTDIVVLVVAADDSVKPQTLEAIKHAKAANVPIIVAINKVDKEEADVQRCKSDLARHGIEIEDFGGDTQVVCVSGKTGQGMDELEESIVTLSEILDHRADASGNVEGWVIEATTKLSGRVATVLIRRGTLKPGTILVAGKTWTRVRTLTNEGGRELDEVGPGMPIEVDGWRDQPIAGDEVLQAPDEHKATSVVDYRLEVAERARLAEDTEAINTARRLEQERRERERQEREAAAAAAASEEDPASSTSPTATLPDPTQTSQPTGQIQVPFIIKADVSGSAEAVSAYILSASSPLIKPTILASAVGAIHESDLALASAAKATVIAFNLPSDSDRRGEAEALGVGVIESDIIYRVLEQVKEVLEDRLPPIVSQKVLGEAEVGAVFEIGVGGRRKMVIAGCKVRNGVVGRGSRVRVLRGGERVYDGTISSLKNVKKDVQEMRKGTECGMGFEEWEAFAVGDQIQTYEIITERRKL